MPEDVAGTSSPDMLLGRIKEKLLSQGVTIEGDSIEAILEAVLAKLDGETTETEEPAGESEVAASVRRELGLKEDADKDAVLLALSALQDRSGAAKEVAALRARIGELEGREAERHAEELIDGAVRVNKLNPRNDKLMAHAHKMARDKPDDFAAWMEVQEAMPPVGRSTPPARGPGDPEKTADERLIANALKEHEGNYGNALIAVQKGLIDEECLRVGCARQRAIENLTPLHPTIFD